jgi:RimJ/RimL family protein N-acetyltransferase
LWHINDPVPGAVIGISLVSPGHGIGPDAIDAMVDFGFESARLRRIWGFAFEWNDRSIATFQRCGSGIEGRIRGAVLHAGVPTDMVQFSMTLGDWRDLDRPRAWELNGSTTSEGSSQGRPGS